MFPGKERSQFSPISPTAEQIHLVRTRPRDFLISFCEQKLDWLRSGNSLDAAFASWSLSNGELRNIVSRADQLPSQIKALVANFDNLSDEAVALVYVAADRFQRLFLHHTYKPAQSLYVSMEISSIEEALARVSQMTNQ